MSGTSQETDCLSVPGFFMAALLAMTGVRAPHPEGEGGLPVYIDGQDEQDFGPGVAAGRSPVPTLSLRPRT